jgi:predicted lysophospholipase L1 biosynthesis ABC-type transport system permease subunit
MAVLRTIWGLIIGTLAAAVLGMAYDYFRPGFIPNPAEYQFVYPWFTGLAGLVAIIVALMITGVRQEVRARPEASAKAPAKAKGKAAAETPSSYDFDKALAEIKSAAPIPPQAGSPEPTKQPPSAEQGK